MSSAPARARLGNAALGLEPANAGPEGLVDEVDFAIDSIVAAPLADEHGPTPSPDSLPDPPEEGRL
eukprot:3666264-Alexandrium_andersonii.AAC.1